MLIMFFINYIIFILSFSVNNYNGDSFFDILYKVFVVSVILGNILALPFHLSSLIVVFMGLNKKSLSYTFIGMIASIIMPLYTCFWHFFLAMGYSGLFTSKVCTLIFITYSILLFLFCLFKALFKVK